MDENTLIKELLAGNRKAFRAIYLKYVDQLYSFGFNIIKNREETIDTIQDLFMWIWEKRGELNIIHLRSYLFAALKFNLTRKVLLSRKREEILNEGIGMEETIEENSLEIKELEGVIMDFIETLPPKAKAVFILSRQKYLKHNEIAKELEISENTVQNHINYSIRKLKIYLSKISYWILILLFIR